MNRVPWCLLAGAIAFAIAVFAGCGGDDDGPLDRGALASQADEICTEFEDDFGRSGNRGVTNEQIANEIRYTNGLVRERQERLQTLEPDEDVREDWEAFLQAGAQYIELNRRVIEAAEAGDDRAVNAAFSDFVIPAAEREQLAEEIGMEVCGMPADPEVEETGTGPPEDLDYPEPANSVEEAGEAMLAALESGEDDEGDEGDDSDADGAEGGEDAESEGADSEGAGDENAEGEETEDTDEGTDGEVADAAEDAAPAADCERLAELSHSSLGWINEPLCNEIASEFAGAELLGAEEYGPAGVVEIETADDAYYTLYFATEGEDYRYAGFEVNDGRGLRPAPEDADASETVENLIAALEAGHRDRVERLLANPELNPVPVELRQALGGEDGEAAEAAQLGINQAFSFHQLDVGQDRYLLVLSHVAGGQAEYRLSNVLILPPAESADEDAGDDEDEDDAVEGGDEA